MKYIVISPVGSDNHEVKEQLEKLQYEIITYCSQNYKVLEDTTIPQWFTTSNIGDMNTQECMCKRATFIQALEDSSFDNDDYIIFGTQAVTKIPAYVLKQTIQQELNKYPEVDIFRLYTTYSVQDSAETSTSEKISNPIIHNITFENFKTEYTSQNNSYTKGDYAFIIPQHSRRKISQLVKEHRVPVDLLLELACSENKLKMRVCKENIFYKLNDIPWNTSYVKKKMALCLSTYKRPSEAMRQIFCMLNQTYDKDYYHIFVAVKGITEHHINTYMLPYLQPYIDENRLTIRYFPNSNQLTNLIDCTRGIDTSDYDLFLKIDDDELYHVKYLEIANEFYQQIPQHHSCTFNSGGLHKLQTINGIPTFTSYFPYKYVGSTIVMTKEAWEITKKGENNAEFVKNIYLKCGKQAISAINWMEDGFIDRICELYGKSNSQGFVINDKKIHNFVTICTANSSVTRGGLVPRNIKNITEIEEIFKENFIHICIEGHEYTAYILNDDLTLLNTNRKASVLCFPENRSSITLRWTDTNREEQFMQKEDGSYEAITFNNLM